MNSHDIIAAAKLIVGTVSGGDEPLPGAVQWVERRLRAGEFSGYKAARRWRMTDADIAAAIESLRPRRAEQAQPRPVAELDRPLLTSMTRTSQRRLAAS